MVRFWLAESAKSAKSIAIEVESQSLNMRCCLSALVAPLHSGMLKECVMVCHPDPDRGYGFIFCFQKTMVATSYY